MNQQIIDNLYEFWEQIGNITHKETQTENYSAVTMDDSDWPNRIFNLKNKTKALEEVLRLSQEGKLPEILLVPKPNDLKDKSYFEFSFSQKNMALNLNSSGDELGVSLNIKRVETEKDSIDFAKTASAAFRYRVDFNLIYKLAKNSETIRLFLYQENKLNLGCGIVFFDSNSNAGLHMIGTLPEGRGKAVGKSMTESLLIEAKKHNKKHCVLHASLMGESIYRKLGFESYQEIETYKILKK